MLIRLLLAALLLLAPAGGWAQSVPGTLTQQSPTLLDACTSTVNSATSGATLTITPPAGQSVYLCAVTYENCAGASAVTPTNPASITTTNLSGSPRWFVGTGAAAGLCQPSPAIVLPRTLKSTVPGTPVTIILPAFAGTQIINFTAWYYTAP